MGRAKELYMRQMEQGWSGVGEKWVCAKCFDDEAIQEFIRENAEQRRCSYCRRFSRNLIAAEMDAVIPFIADGLNYEYEDAANGVGYEGAEGGYQLPTMDSWELLEDIGLDVENDELREDLREAFFGRLWVPCDPYADRRSDTLRYDWEAFSHQVKHKTRFVFFRTSTPERDHGEREPYEILDDLRTTVQDAELIETIPAGRQWFRAHEHSDTETPSGAERLGSPPIRYATHNRMSPAGISMLYVSLDAGTAIAEISSGPSAGTAITVAEFQNTRPMRILDLSNIPKVPSLFDSERRHKRMALIFLRHFAEELSKPISKSECPYEYVPTQVMTEYFRHLFHQPREIVISPYPQPFDESLPKPIKPLTYTDEPPKLDGIAFRSSKRAGGVNYTLFIGPEQCSDSASRSEIVMVLTGTARHPLQAKTVSHS